MPKNFYTFCVRGEIYYEFHGSGQTLLLTQHGFMLDLRRFRGNGPPPPPPRSGCLYCRSNHHNYPYCGTCAAHGRSVIYPRRFEPLPL